MTKLFGIMAALAIIVISASAAGQFFFGSDTPQEVQVPKYEISEHRISSLLPVAAYKNLTENLTQELDDVIANLDEQPEESRSDDADGAAEEEESDVASSGEGVFGDLVTGLVPAAQTKKLAATAESAQDTVAGAIELKEDVEKVTATISKKKAVLLAIYGVWKATFTNAWPFLKGVASAVWDVTKDGSQYSPPDGAEATDAPSSQ